MSLNLCLQYEDGGDFQLTFMNRGQDINAWNQQDKSNENKSFFCGFISKLAFEVENQAAPCTNACIIWGVKKFTNSTTFCTFWIFQIFVATSD